MLKQWIVELGGVVISDRDHKEDGFAIYNPLLLRYSWHEVMLAWRPTFDRWANSRDWVATMPSSKAEFQMILDKAERLGREGRIPSNEGRTVRLSLSPIETLLLTVDS